MGRMGVSTCVTSSSARFVLAISTALAKAAFEAGEKSEGCRILRMRFMGHLLSRLRSHLGRERKLQRQCQWDSERKRYVRWPSAPSRWGCLSTVRHPRHAPETSARSAEAVFVEQAMEGLAVDAGRLGRSGDVSAV